MAAVAPAHAQVQITIHDSRVSLVAKDATLEQILAEWAKVGQTMFVNSERIPGGPLTLQLTDVPEAEALDILLRVVSGYIAVPRTPPVAGLSRFDRIIVMPTVGALVGDVSTAASQADDLVSWNRDPESVSELPLVPFIREDYPADDEVNWNRDRDPEPVPQPLPVPFIREDYPADDEVNWNRDRGPEPVPQHLPVVFLPEDYPTDDEVNWNHGPEPVPQPPALPLVRENYAADDEVNWNSQLTTGGVPERAASPTNKPGMPTAPAGVAVPGMPTPAPVPRQRTPQGVPSDEVML